jgi:predicted HAD superfamily Cof-like phosphohydrolase
MERQLLQVREFQLAFGAPIPKTPMLLDSKRARLRQDLLIEEVNELEQADNIVDVADALIDILYIVYGTLHEYGLADRAVMLFDEVHRSNMSKVGPDGVPIFREDGKVLKPESYSPPKLRLIIDRDFDMYNGNQILADIAKRAQEETNKVIERKIKDNLNMIDRFLLWLNEKIEKNLKKKVIVKHPQTSLGDITVSIYGYDYVIKS